MFFRGIPGGTRLARAAAAFFLLACLILPPRSGAGEPRRFEPRSLGGYEFQFELVTPRVEVGEPVWLRLHVTNQDAITLTNKVFLAWDLSSDLIVFVHYPGAQPIRLYGASERNIAPLSAVPLKYKESRALDYSLLYLPESTSGLLFERPGTYALSVGVRVKVGDQRMNLEYPQILLEVTPPSGNSAPALHFLNGLAAKDLDLTRAMIRDLEAQVATERTRPSMDRLVEIAPASALAPHALFATARQDFFAKRFAEAREALRRLQREYPEHPLADDALLLAAYSATLEGDSAQALDAALLLFLKYPDSNRHLREGPLFEEVLEPALRPAAPATWTFFDSEFAPTQKELLAWLDEDKSRMAEERREARPPRRPWWSEGDRPALQLREALSAAAAAAAAQNAPAPRTEP